MKVQTIYSWAFTFSIALLLFISETQQSKTVQSNAKQRNAGYKPTSSRRDIISGFNRENLVDSHEEYFIDPSSLANQLTNQEDPRSRSEAAGQQSVYLGPSEIDENASPLGETQLPTIAAPDYKIAYSDGLPYPTHSSSNQGSLTVYDTPQEPLDESDSNTVKIADPLANKKLFSNEGFSHGMGELNNAINTLLIDKVLSSDNDKDFNKELKILSEEFSKDEEDEKSEGKKPAVGKKHGCQPSAKSIFANCKKKRSAVCSPEDRDTFDKNALNIHNLFRKIHGVPDLEMNERLSKDAQDYAEHLAKTASSAHSLRKDRPGQGENIAVGCTSAGSELRSKEAISQWYSKACQNNFDFSGYKKGVEPFAQLVWKSTAFLGMGKAVSNRDGNLCTYIVARYSPEGDKNSFAENVLKGTFSKNGICSSSCVVKGNVAHTDGPKVMKAQNEKMKTENEDEPEFTSVKKPDVKGKGENHESRKEENYDTSSEEKPKNTKRPVQPEMKKVEQLKAEDKMEHESLGSTKIRNNDVKQEQGGTEKVQKPQSTVEEKAHTTAQELSTQASEVSHGLSKLTKNNMRLITDQDFAAANSQQHNHVNVSSPQKERWTQDTQRATEGSVKDGMQIASNERSTEGSIKDGMQITSHEPTPKSPMLINITFPKQLQTKNNSMIQITVGDDDSSKAALPEQAGFKPVVNFAGKSGHAINSDEEYLDKVGRNEKLNEGTVSDHGLKFMEDSPSRSSPAVGYKISDYGFDISKEHHSQTAQEAVANMQNGSTSEVTSVDTHAASAGPQHMFQDRKGMNSKNSDNAVTYLKIATKLMHGKGEADSVDYFMPKQLESETAASYTKGRNDYGFTDQPSEEQNASKGKNDQSSKSRDNKMRHGNKDSNRNRDYNKLNKDMKSKENHESREGKGQSRNNEDTEGKSEKYNKDKKYKGNKNNKNVERINNNDSKEKNEKTQKYLSKSKHLYSESFKSSFDDSDNSLSSDKVNFVHESEGNEPEVSTTNQGFESFRNRSDTYATDNAIAKEKAEDDIKAFKSEGSGPKMFGSGKHNQLHSGDERGAVSDHQASSTHYTALNAEEGGNEDSEYGFTSNVEKLNMNKHQRANSKENAFATKASDKSSGTSSSSRKYAKKQQDDFGFTADAENIKIKEGERTKSHEKQSDFNTGKKGPPDSSERHKKKQQNDFGLTDATDNVNTNGGKHVHLNEKSPDFIDKEEEPVASSYSDLNTNKHQQAAESKEDSSAADNKKFLKLIDAEISSHGIEKKKHYHKKFENNKFMKLEKQILSQQDNIFYKRPEISKFEEKNIRKESHEKVKNEDLFTHSKSSEAKYQSGDFQNGNRITKFAGSYDNSQMKVNGEAKGYNKEWNTNTGNDRLENHDINDNHGNLHMQGQENGDVTNSAGTNRQFNDVNGGISNNETKLFGNDGENNATLNSTMHSMENISQTEHKVLYQNSNLPQQWMKLNGSSDNVGNYSIGNVETTNKAVDLSNVSYSAQNQSESQPYVKRIEGTSGLDDANNATTINVGTGFINIKYEKPTSKIQERAESTDSGGFTQKQPTSNVAGSFHSNSKESVFMALDSSHGAADAAIEGHRNLESKVGTPSAESGGQTDNVEHHRKASLQAEGINVATKEQSFSPVIERKNNHHFVIQIRPTHALEREKHIGGAVRKFSDDEISSKGNKDDSEFIDVSKTRHYAKNNSAKDISSDDIQEDLMTDNVGASLKTEENIKAYMKNDSRDDFEGMKERGNYRDGLSARVTQAVDYRKQSEYETASYKSGTRLPDKEEENRIASSWKMKPESTSEEESFSVTKQHKERKFGKEDEKGSLVSGTTQIKEEEPEYEKSKGKFDEKEEQSHSSGNMGYDAKLQKNATSGSMAEELIQAAQYLSTKFSSSSKQTLGESTHNVDHMQHNGGHRLYAKYDSSDIIPGDNEDSYQEGDSLNDSETLPKGKDNKKEESSSINNKNEGKTENGQLMKDQHQDSKSFSTAEAANDNKLFKSIENIINQEQESNGESKQTHTEEDSTGTEGKISHGHKASNNRDYHSSSDNQGEPTYHAPSAKESGSSFHDTFSNERGGDVSDRKGTDAKPACKSNCEKPFSRETSHGKDEFNIVGLNLQTGYDRFSGFKKVQSGEDLRGRKFEDQAKTSKFVNDESSGHDEIDNHLIFIPEEAIRKFQKDMTKEHNKYRRIHESPYLYLDSKLSRDSQMYAKELARKGSVAHSSIRNRPETGESIEKLCSNNGGMPTANEVLKKWYNEVCEPGYIFARDGIQPGTGHFTQVVWKNTKSLGIGLAASKEPDGRICSYVVARYFKAGNDLATIRSNVAKGKFHSCNQATENSHPTSRYLASHSSPRKKHNRPTQSYKNTARHTSKPAYVNHFLKKRPSQFSSHTARTHKYLKPAEEELSSVSVGKHTKQFMEKNSHRYDDMTKLDLDNNEFYKVSPTNSAKIATMFANRAQSSEKSDYHRKQVSTEHNKAINTEKATYAQSQIHSKAYGSAGRSKYHGKPDYHFNVEHVSGMDQNSLGPEKQQRAGSKSAQDAALYEKPRYEEFSLNHGSSKGRPGAMNPESEEFDVTYLMKQKSNSFSKVPHSDSEEKVFGTHSHGNHRNNKQFASLSQGRYNNKNSNNEFYHTHSPMHSSLQSQVKPKHFGHKQQVDAGSTSYHNDKANVNSEFMVPTMKSYHGKQGHLPTKTFLKQKSMSLQHKQRKPVVAEESMRFSAKQSKQMSDNLDSRPNQGGHLLKGWTKTPAHQTNGNSLKPLITQNVQHHSHMVEKQENGENQNMAHFSSSSDEKEESKFSKEMNHNIKGEQTSQKDSHRVDSNVNLNPKNAYNSHSMEATEENSLQAPVLTHPKAAVSAIDSLKVDKGYLAGMHAAFGLGSEEDARDFYDEPVGKIAAPDEAYAGIGNVRDLQDVTSVETNMPGAQTDKEMDLNSLREEGSKIEESITNFGRKNPDQSFEEKLINSVKLGKADVAVEKNPEDYKVPAVLMDEYRYNTPENGGGENMYESDMVEKLGTISGHGRDKSTKQKPIKGKVSSDDRKDSNKFAAKSNEKQPDLSNGLQGEAKIGPGVKGRQEKAPTGKEVNVNMIGDGKHEIGFAISDKVVNQPDVGQLNENKLRPHNGFKSGFEDALSALGRFDDGKIMDVAATKKGILSRVPTYKIYQKQSMKAVNGMKKDGIQFSDNRFQNDEKSYDTSRTRHFVIDKNHNLVLTPGEETGSIADYESKHLSDLARQATYNVKSVAKMFKGVDVTGLNSLQKVIPDQNDFQSGVIAWSGPYNPGLPNEEEVKQSDISGQDLIENLEKPNEGLLREGSNPHVIRPQVNIGNNIYKNGTMASDSDGKIMHKDPPYEDIVANFHNSFKNASGMDGELDGRFDKNEKKFIKIQGKVFDDDMKLFAEKDLEENANSARRTHEEDISTFRQNALMWHNKLRCVHYADRLRLNDSLSKEADDYANEIVSKHNGILDHSNLQSRKDEGENLAMTCSANRKTLSGAEATFKWYNDICEKGYDFRSDVVQKGTGHFTQLAWQKTTDFGIGRAMLKKNGRYCTVIVARYYPKGNIQKEFADNVKLGAYSDQTCENLAKELSTKTEFKDCNMQADKNKKLAKFIQQDVNNALANTGRIQLKQPVNVSREREKARLNHEIQKVTEIINRLEKESSNQGLTNVLEGSSPNTGAFSASDNVQGEVVTSTGSAKGKGSSLLANAAGHKAINSAFSDLGGTGSPVIVYHGVTGFFEDPKTFTNIGVETHNKLRKIHKAPEVALDPVLTMEAFKYATYLTQLGFLKHDPKLPKEQGENLAIGCFDNNSEMSAEDAVSRWYYEACQPGYDFNSKAAASGTGHFTQVVWKSTKKIGIAKQTRMHGNLKCTYIVARYSPAGNAHGGFEKNVEKGDFNESVCKELMEDLLKFQQRNEKLVPQLESGLKQAQAEAKVQEKLMALMQLKAMEKQKSKQKAQKQGQRQGQKPIDIKQNKKPKVIKDASKTKGFLKGSKMNGFPMQGSVKNQAKIVKGKAFGDQFSKVYTANRLPKQNPHFVTGVLNNGLKTIVESNHQLMHIGPTVKIVENRNGGGLMYKKIEGPSVARQLKLQNGQIRIRTQNGPVKSRLMSDGRMTEEVVREDEFTNPLDLIGVHEASSQNPFKTPHAFGLNKQGFTNSGRRYSSPHLTSSTFDTMTGRIIEKDMGDIRQFKNRDSVQNWGTGTSGNARQALRKVHKIPPSRFTQNSRKVVKNTKPQAAMKNNLSQKSFSANKQPLTMKINQRYNTPKKLNVNRLYKKPVSKVSWPSGSPLVFKPAIQLKETHHMPASLMRILQGKPSPHTMTPLKTPIIAKHVQEHKLPDSLLRILKGKSTNNNIKTFTPKKTVHPIVHQQPHKLPESLLRMINAKSNSFKPNTAVAKTFAPHPNPEHEEHKIPESLQRILQAKKAVNNPTPNYKTPKYLTEKPYSIKLNGHEVPYSLFKMLTAEAASGKDPKVAKYLTEKPFKIVQNHHEIPDSLKKILSGRSKPASANLAKNGANNLGPVRKIGGPVHSVSMTMSEGLNAGPKTLSKPNAYDTEHNGLNLDEAPRMELGVQAFQQPAYPQIESYASVQQNPLQQPSTFMFANTPTQYQNQDSTFNLATFPTPVIGTTRTTVAGRYPATTTVKSSGPIANGIKGPSLANIEPALKPKDSKPLVVKTLDSPTPTSFNPYASTTPDGQLVSLDTEKDREEFERTSLETHNLYRRMHSANPLKLDYKMSIEAEEYAKKIAESGRLDHSGTEDGENIASVCRKGNSLMTGMEATDIWYKEVCSPGYDFKSERPGGSGHFTQVVWKGTTQLGVGRAEAMRNGLLCTYVVARYRPAGNFIGEFSKNVLKGSFDGTQCSTTTKKSTITKGPKKGRAKVSKSVRRSRIPHHNHVKSSRKTLVDFGGESTLDDKSDSMHIDDVIANKANSVWLPDLESGFHGSDLAGMIPLTVEAGQESHLKKYANATMDQLNENDHQLAVNFASKLREQVEKALSTKTAESKSKTGEDVPSKVDIDAASIGFQNMDASFKKSEPTLPPGAKSLANNGISLGTGSEKIDVSSKPMVTQSGNTRSAENALAPDIAAKVNQAVQKLESAAQSVSSAASPAITNGVANSAMTGIKTANSNAAMAKFAANMISAANEGSNQASAVANVGNMPPQSNQNSPVAGVANPPANGLSTNSDPAGSLAASNMAASNQQALSKAAEDKKIESAGYKPTEFEQSGLNAHNKYRAVHDAPPLVLNQDLSNDAEAWAQQCAALGMARRSPSPDGENVIESCKLANQEMTATEAVETWYSEICNPGYEFDAAEITGTERFTQVVWRSTTEMGIGKATRVKADLLCTYIVARYRPSGNVLGDIKGNVLRGTLDSKHFCEQFLAAAKVAGKNRILDNLPVKSERMEEAGSVGSTLHAGKGQPEDEIVAGGDDPAADGASKNKKDFRMEALYTHNRFRAVHNAPPLQLDVKKCQEAEELAASLAAKGSLMRAKDKIDGQNIAMSCNKDGIEMSGDEATNKWYNEVCNPGYDFKGPYAFGAAHFMQVVWASSKKFGIGKATTTLDNMLCTWVVALYEPSGVMRSMEKENVLFGLFDYRYCDTFGKGGGGKGASNGVIHNNADSKISAPNAAGQPAGKRDLLLKSKASSQESSLQSSSSNIVDLADAKQVFITSTKVNDKSGDIAIKDEVYGNEIMKPAKGNAAEKKNIKKNHKIKSRTNHNRRKINRSKKHTSHRRSKHHHKRHHHHQHRKHKRHYKTKKNRSRIR